MRSAFRFDSHHPPRRADGPPVAAALLVVLAAACGGGPSVDETDSGAAPLAGVTCDPRAPVCPADQQCTATHWDLSAPWTEPRCASVPTESAGAASDPCFAVAGEIDTCAAGLTCTNFGSGEGFCMPRCSEPGSTCPAETVCAPVDPARGLSLCMLACATDADCGSPWLSCVEAGEVRYCDSHR